MLLIVVVISVAVELADKVERFVIFGKVKHPLDKEGTQPDCN